jgi:hypothetical protein
MFSAISKDAMEESDSFLRGLGSDGFRKRSFDSK